ncbi:MAG: hypothetical protein AAFS12_00015 [Cyanobacteria bacterium J06632_19]
MSIVSRCKSRPIVIESKTKRRRKTWKQEKIETLERKLSRVLRIEEKYSSFKKEYVRIPVHYFDDICFILDETSRLLPYFKSKSERDIYIYNREKLNHFIATNNSCSVLV